MSDDEKSFVNLAIDEDETQTSAAEENNLPFEGQ